MGVDEKAPSAAEAAEAGLSEAQIAVHWREEEYCGSLGMNVVSVTLAWAPVVRVGDGV
jgi:hypothetical protein